MATKEIIDYPLTGGAIAVGTIKYIDDTEGEDETATFIIKVEGRVWTEVPLNRIYSVVTHRRCTIE